MGLDTVQETWSQGDLSKEGTSGQAALGVTFRKRLALGLWCVLWIVHHLEGGKASQSTVAAGQGPSEANGLRVPVQ